MSGREPPLDVEEPDVLALPRYVGRGAIRGLRTTAGPTFAAALLMLLATLGVGWVSPAAALAFVAFVCISAFAVGAVSRRDELPPAAGMIVGADGITAKNEIFTRYYPWSAIVGTRRSGNEVTLMLEGGYAFRVPFRGTTRRRQVEERIATERQAHATRIASGTREQRDAVDPGQEARFIARMRQRLGSDYRHGHETVDALAAELLDPDFQLQQRLGAAIALANAKGERAPEALRAARDFTASIALREALDALLEGTASEEQLVGWLADMHPRPRQFAPVGRTARPRIDAPPVRIGISDGAAEAAAEEAAAEEAVDETQAPPTALT